MINEKGRAYINRMIESYGLSKPDTFRDDIYSGQNAGVVAHIFGATLKRSGLSFAEAGAILGITEKEALFFDRLDMKMSDCRRCFEVIQRLLNPTAHERIRLAAYRAGHTQGEPTP